MKKAAKEQNRLKRQEKFLQQAKEIHGDRYGYSEVKYIRSSDKIKIICKIHGVFEQLPKTHLSSNGCRACGYHDMIHKNRKSLDQFILESNIIHNNKYDYSISVYKNSASKINIKCPIHGLFEQTALSHLQGQEGCSDCNHINKSNSQTKTLEEFIIEARQIHGNKYDYSQSVYLSGEMKIKIRCPVHGYWLQKPKGHLNGRGCPDCGVLNRSIRHTKTLKDFITDAVSIHGEKYDYTKSIYMGDAKKIEIMCKKHGSFMQTANGHLNGYGCPECGKHSSQNVSSSETKWLNSKGIAKKNRNRYIVIGEQKYNVDAYIPRSKTIYEFYGDYWHGNPDIYDQNKINKTSKKSFGDLYRKTIEREALFVSAGYKIVSIWERDWKRKQKKKQSKSSP